MTLGPAEFHPQPKVDSVVIQIAFYAERSGLPALSSDEYALFVQIVRATFSQRRKTILNTLTTMHLFPEREDRNEVKALTEQAIAAAGLSPRLRPEAMGIQAFEDLSRSFLRLRLASSE